MDIPEYYSQVRMPPRSGLHHLRREVDPDPERRFQSRQQVPPAAAQFENALMRRHDILIDARQPVVVVTARPGRILSIPTLDSPPAIALHAASRPSVRSARNRRPAIQRRRRWRRGWTVRYGRISG